MTIDWIQTYDGNAFHWRDPDPGIVTLYTIAHSLGMTCRFGGHCEQFYSVAEHSILVSMISARMAVERNIQDIAGVARFGLLHDAAEAYVGDVITQLKTDSHRRIEDHVLGVILAKYGVHPTDDERQIVHAADMAALKMERDQLMKRPPKPWQDPVESAPDVSPMVIGLGPRDAKRAFLCEANMWGLYDDSDPEVSE